MISNGSLYDSGALFLVYFVGSFLGRRGEFIIVGWRIRQSLVCYFAALVGVRPSLGRSTHSFVGQL